MKKLLLTSAGLVNKEISQALLEELSVPIEKARVLVVAYAQNKEEKFYVNESKQELLSLGFKNIIVANLNYSLNFNNDANFEVIYVCGGNTFAILNKLRETRLNELIIKQVNQGAVYVGVSAGSIIAGPDIEIAGWGREGDENEIGLTDLRGFGLTEVVIFPHFHKELQEEVEEFKKGVDYKVIELTNNQAVFVKDEENKIVGTA